jgi:DNA-binding transcriptional LysR family regulator
VLNLRRLEVLAAVRRGGSLSAAARELGYTQPAISHHLSRLEAEVGTALTVRIGRGVRLTDAGEALASHGEALLARVEAAEEDVAAIAGLRAGRVRVASFPSATASFVPRAMALLRARHPEVDVSLVEDEPPESVARVRSGESDLALAFEYPGVAVDPGADLAHVPLLRDPMRAVLATGHPLAGATGDAPLDIAALADDTWIAGCERCRTHLVHVCEQAGFTPRILFATDDYVAVQGLVAEGLGVCLLPEMALRSAPRTGVVVRPVSGDPARDVGAVVAAGRRPPAVEATLAVLAEAVAAWT